MIFESTVPLNLVSTLLLSVIVCPTLFFPQLSSSESIQQQLSFLNKQLLLLGEAHKLCVQELHQAGPDTSKVQGEAQRLMSSVT